MGVSTDALLVYGWVWHDEINLLDRDSERDYEQEWPNVVATLRGISDPWGDYPARDSALSYEENDRISKQWMAEHRFELDEYRASRDAIEEELGCTIDWHGSDEWSVPIVCIKSASIQASRGSPQQIEPQALTVDPSWDDMLATFVETLSIDTSDASGPGWFMASWWG